MSSELEQLRKAIEEIWEASQSTGLDPFPIHFEIVPPSVMYEIGSYGLPGRFSHWTHGKAFHQMKTMYDYGLSKIYELIINTNPAQAFLMEGNSLIQNKLVIAHVIGHSDFFKNNVYFQHTNRQMAETAGVTAERIRAYERQHGEKAVEEFLDAVLSIQEHIDPHLRIARRDPAETPRTPERRRTAYDDLWSLRAKEEAPATPPARRRIPEEPEKDLLLFLLQYAPDLEDWQRDILNIVRNEMLYFLPQMQTKVMNEGWACATGESLLVTERGILRFADLYDEAEPIAVGSGGPGQLHRITDFHREARVPTLRIRTRRGYTIEGALEHRVLLPDGRWAHLKELRLGDRVVLAGGTEVWAAEPVRIDDLFRQEVPLHEVARAAGTSLWAVRRHLEGGRTRKDAEIASALEAAGCGTAGEAPASEPARGTAMPRLLDERLAHLLGYFVAQGSATEGGIRLACGDPAYARRLADLAGTTLQLPVAVREEDTAAGPRWQIELRSREALRLFRGLDAEPASAAAARRVPDPVLRSPRGVVAAFLAGLFDAAADAGAAGIDLSAPSRELVETVQVLLLNFGILSTRREEGNGLSRLEIAGASAARFHEQIGFRHETKRAALQAGLAASRDLEPESAVDEIVAIEPGKADVYDITVETAHAYVANGFVNHNSYWHSRILREMDLTPEEHVEFTRLHASVLSPSPRGTSINPYYVGFKIFEDIERRWNGELTEEERREFQRANHGQDWPHRGRGREKMFEVRELENDVSFLRNYLTRNLVEELDLYIYQREGDEWVVVEKDWEKVRDAIVESMTNFGFPYLVVEDGDYRRARELYIRHCYDGRELDQHYAFRTMRYLYQLWGRPVHLETVVDGEPTVWTFDGENELMDHRPAS